MLVRLVFPRQWKSLFRLISGGKKQIDDIFFTTDEVDEADLVVVVNFSPKPVKMRAREAWIFHQEPSNRKFFGHWIKAYKYADRVFGSWQDLTENECQNFYKAPSSVIWGVSGDYDFYNGLKPEKTVPLSVITSSKRAFEGHKERLDFLLKLREELKDTDFNFEIKGMGFNPVKTKDEVLIPSKYTLCIENTKEPFYITEKLTDAFLCGCMPVYYGAPNVFDYFPKGSLIYLDDFNVSNAKKIIKDTINDNLYEKNKKEINEAKELVLNRYNFFHNIVLKIREFDLADKPVKEIYIPKSRQMKHPVLSKIKTMLKFV